jgi:ABC-type lipoprotein release transport system permease subunit
MEALWLGLLGAIAGDLLGLSVAAAIDTLGLAMPPPPGAVDPIPLHLALTPTDMTLAVALMMAVLALASLFPLARTARLRIVDALGHV